MIKKERFIDKMKEHIRDHYGTIAEAARQLDVNAQSIRNAINEKEAPPQPLIDDMDYIFHRNKPDNSTFWRFEKKKGETK